MTPGFVKTAPIAWFASHYHTAQGTNQPYKYSYLYAAYIDVPQGATTLTLPDNDKIKILAVTVANKTGNIRAAQHFYDQMGDGKDRQSAGSSRQ